MRVVAFLLAFALLGCTAPPPPKVVLLGDSITLGYVGGTPAPPYAERLATSLGESVELTNVACGGLTVAIWLDDAEPAFCDGKPIGPNLFQARLLEHLPADVVVVLLGTNDATALGGEIPVDVYGEQLDALVAQLAAHGAGRILVLAPPFIANMAKASMLLRGYGAEIARVCAAREDVVCGPDLFTLLQGSDFTGRDLHPNAAGHAKIAVAVEAALRPLIGLEASAPDS